MKKLVLIVIFIGILSFFAYSALAKYYNINLSVIKNTYEKPPIDIAEEINKFQKDEKTLLTIPDGFKISIFAKSSSSPRVLAFDGYGNLYATLTQKGELVAYPDKDKDGKADREVVILKNLNKPHGIIFKDSFLFIAETDKVVRYTYSPVDFLATEKKVLFNLPESGRHFTRTIKINGNKIYTSIGSSCDVCIEKDWERASILVSDLDGGNLATFALGLRNTVFFAFDDKGKIWGNDMGRDFLGDNEPPDELNIIEEGKNYGWPYCFGDKKRDIKFEKNTNLNYCENTHSPAFSYPAHSAPLGLTFINSKLFQSDNGNILAAFHGSWNSTKPVGYKIVKIKMKNGVPQEMTDFITGWLTENNKIIGRPVDLAFGENGILYISDDKANVIYSLYK